MKFRPPEDRDGFRIAVICALTRERDAVMAMLDEAWDAAQYRKAPGDHNTYRMGRIGAHNVVVALLPGIGIQDAASTSASFRSSFMNIALVLAVGVCGGVPTTTSSGDILLGDVILSKELVDVTFGRQYDNNFEIRDTLADRFGRPSKEIRAFLATMEGKEDRARLEANSATYLMELCQKASFTSSQFPGNDKDIVYPPQYRHKHQRSMTCPCATCRAAEDALAKAEIAGWPENEIRTLEDEVKRALICAQPAKMSCEDLECDPKKGVVRQSPNRALITGTTIRLPALHFGVVGSGNSVLKSGYLRDELAVERKIIAFEMEGAGIWDNFPLVVVKAVCDYADSHKSKDWQDYAAASAAACMKALLMEWPATDKPSLGGANAVSFESTNPHSHYRQYNNTGSGQQFIYEQMSGTQNFNFTVEPDRDYEFHRPVGLCLGQAPSIDTDYFIGRDRELAEMAKLLLPNNEVNDQQRLVLGGMGGIGKTQLAVAYARRHTKQYDSVFWLNAISEATLATSFRTIAERIFAANDYQAIDTDKVTTYVKGWLSDPRNTRWLLIYDNYDEPQTYRIHAFYPDTTHGTIIITTRRPSLVNGHQLSVRHLHDIEAGLRILETRSGRRDVMNDVCARRIAERLAGLPLALATAGAFLRKSVWSFQQYLDAYEERWNVTARVPLFLPDYSEQKTFFTTWGLSYDRLAEEVPDAAGLLKLFAYFDHQAIWYELLQAGINADVPEWLSAVASDPIDFENVMHALVDYCFVETQVTTQAFSIHTCVHDWSLHSLNETLESWSYWYAFDCVFNSIKKDDWYLLGHVQYARLTPHAIRLTIAKFIDFKYSQFEDGSEKPEHVAQLLQSQGHLQPALSFINRTLVEKEKVLGLEHTSTLRTAHTLGLVYWDQRDFVKAEQMFTRVLSGYEKALGAKDLRIISTLGNLGTVFLYQGKLAESEKILERALTRAEEAFGLEDHFTLTTVCNLGVLYRTQGKLVEAEQMFLRAMTGANKALGPEHDLSITTINKLGLLYQQQGKLEDAEQHLSLSLARQEKVLGMNHTLTLWTINSLGDVYRSRGKLADAEQMYSQALTRAENSLRPEHSLTIIALCGLGLLYRQQKKRAEAEQMFTRALAGAEKTHGPDDTYTLTMAIRLGRAYWAQGKLTEAEALLQRAATGRQKVLGPDHADTKWAFRRLERLKRFMLRKRVMKALLKIFLGLLGSWMIWTVLMSTIVYFDGGWRRRNEVVE